MPSPSLVGIIDTIDDIAVDGRIPVRFADQDAVAYLRSSDPLFEHNLWLMKRLQELQRPVYVDLAEPLPAAVGQRISRILIPLITRVIDIEQTDAPDIVHVRLTESSARHVLRTAGPKAVANLAGLWASVNKGTVLFVTHDSATREIIDVEFAFDKYQTERPVVTAASFMPTSDVIGKVSIVSEAEFLRVLAIINDTKCGVPRPASGCIPFNYPDDGCWARAQRICELFETGKPLVMAKVWIYGDLEIRSANHPFCSVRWDWHCAPLIKVGTGKLMVLDPSLFDGGAAPYLEFFGAVQGISETRQTASDVYHMAEPDDARGEISANEAERELEVQRLRLEDRIATEGFSPPYNRC